MQMFLSSPICMRFECKCFEDEKLEHYPQVKKLMNSLAACTKSWIEERIEKYQFGIKGQLPMLAARTTPFPCWRRGELYVVKREEPYVVSS